MLHVHELSVHGLVVCAGLCLPFARPAAGQPQAPIAQPAVPTQPQALVPDLTRTGLPPRLTAVECRVITTAARIELESAESADEESAAHRARQMLDPVLWHPDQPTLETWKAAAVIAIILKDKALAPFAIDGIMGFPTQVEADDNLIEILAQLHRLDTENRAATVP